MTITLPTVELLGLIGDVAGFAFPKPEFADANAVRIAWTGDLLRMEATDTIRAARSDWHPDDEPTSKVGQSTLFRSFGGADDPWSLIAALGDVQEIAKIYKLPGKEGGCPLTLDYDDGNLRIRRSRDTGHSAVTTILEGRMLDWPGVTTLDRPVLPEPAIAISYPPAHLAAFADVRQRGTMTLTLAGPDRDTRVTIGERFTATIRPERAGRRDPQLALAGAGAED